MWRHKDFSNTNSESPEKMLSDDMLRFVFVYDARFADALYIYPRTMPDPSGFINRTYWRFTSRFLFHNILVPPVFHELFKNIFFDFRFKKCWFPVRLSPIISDCRPIFDMFLRVFQTICWPISNDFEPGHYIFDLGDPFPRLHES